MLVNSRQAQLNLPFEFLEVVVSSREKVKLQKGLAESQLFESGSNAYVVQEFRTRELSVRLRTINNACDAMASLPDGTPLTEVSMYGSRDRQYLAGPYDGVKRLLAGELPSPLTVRENISSAQSIISQSFKRLDPWLSSLTSSGHVKNVEIQGQLTQFLPVDAKYIRKAMEELAEIISDLRKLDQEVIDWKDWWAPWGEPAESVLERIPKIIAKQKGVLDKFAQLVIPPEQYSAVILNRHRQWPPNLLNGSWERTFGWGSYAEFP